MYGELILDLILDAVPASDLIPLRCVNHRARDFIDSRIFKHVTLKTDPEAHGDRVVPVITETEHRLPVPALTPMSPHESIRLLFDYLGKYTTVLDVEAMNFRLLEHIGYGNTHLDHLQALRLKSDLEGYHTYDLFDSFGARTVVVFPSFFPSLPHREEPTIIPDGATKLVQHISFAFDWRGPVLFQSQYEFPSDVTDEVWIMTHADIDADLCGYEDLEELHQEIADQIVRRLNVGINLTIVGYESVPDWGNSLFGVRYQDYETPTLSNLPDINEKTKQAIRYSLEVKMRLLSHLDFKTWDEYAASLSPEELEFEKLPAAVSMVSHFHEPAT